MTETVVCVGAVVCKGNQVLLVRQAEGHPLQGKWTIPWGRLDPGESPSAAALREVREEGNVRAEIVGLLGVQEIPPPWNGQLAILYLCSHVEGEPTPDHRETDAARYFADSDIETLTESVEPFSRWLSRRVLNGQVSLTREDPTNPFRPKAGYI